MKHYSKVLGEYIFIGDKNDEGLICYNRKEIEVIKTLRKVTKDDSKFFNAVKTVHRLKKELGATINGWDIPWGDHASQPKQEESDTRSFWMQQQQDYSMNISREIKSRTRVKKSAVRLENLLKYQDEHKYK